MDKESRTSGSERSMDGRRGRRDLKRDTPPTIAGVEDGGTEPRPKQRRQLPEAGKDPQLTAIKEMGT